MVSWRARASVTAAAVLALVMLGGCGGTPTAGPSESPSPTATEPSSSPSATKPTPPPLPKATNDKAGRKAFARWFLKAYVYALETNDPAPLLKVGAKKEPIVCGYCSFFAKHLRKQKGVLTGVDYNVTYSYQQLDVEHGVDIVTMVAKTPARRRVSASGHVRKRYPADPHVIINVGMKYAHGKYLLTGWKLKGSKK